MKEAAKRVIRREQKKTISLTIRREWHTAAMIKREKKKRNNNKNKEKATTTTNVDE